jgi:hypothetical protein
MMKKMRKKVMTAIALLPIFTLPIFVGNIKNIDGCYTLLADSN